MFQYLVCLVRVAILFILILQTLVALPTQAMSNLENLMIGRGGLETSSSVTSENASSSQSSADPTVFNVWPNYQTLSIDKNSLKPLHPSLNHNAKADRINLIFYSNETGTNFNNLRQVIINTLAVNRDYIPFNKDPAKVMGTFNIEPFKSNVNKFNFWLYEKSVDSARSFEFEYFTINDPAAFGLKFTTPVAISTRPSITPGDQFSGREYASSALIEGNENISNYQNQGIQMYYNDKVLLSTTLINGITLAHELGHALFGLGDEYFEKGITSPTYTYPNCAQTLKEANSWWTQEMNQVDPFFYEYRDKLIKYLIDTYPDYFRMVDNSYEQYEYLQGYEGAGKWNKITPNDIVNEEIIRIKPVEGGCFSDSINKVFRPSKTSIMKNGSFPVFGSVNRTMGERVLNLFSGNEIFLTKNLNLYNFVKLNGFDPASISPAKCQLKIFDGTTKKLGCDFENQKTDLDKNTVFKIYIQESDKTDGGFGSGIPIIDATKNIRDIPSKKNNPKNNFGGAGGSIIIPTGAVECHLSVDTSLINCNDYDMSSFDSNKQYNIVLAVQNINGSGFNPYFSQVIFGNNATSYTFKFSDLVTKNIAISQNNILQSSSQNPNSIRMITAYQNNSSSLTGLITVRTGGEDDDKSPKSNATVAILIGFSTIVIFFGIYIKKRKISNLSIRVSED